ncbi:MAG: trypsin-like peptidase domain-containing protein [Clostridia bacterium]|nr:trypsin-like peptidase domain-containing protein [Clostridia bacterium]
MVKSQSGANIFDGAINGILEIETESGQGSGFLLDDMGYALTNAHVVTDDGVPNKEILVRIAGEEITAKIVKIGDVSADIDDLALIKLSRVPKNSISLVLGNYDDVKTGEEIFVIGNSKGEGTCITKGIVSDRNRKGRIMTDAAVNPGNSGGPVFNQRGFVVGIIVSVRINADGMKYAIPVDVIRSFLIEQCNYSITQNTKNNFINANYEDDNQQNCTEKNKNNSIATNKCPNCGGRFNIKLLDAQIVCPYCGYTELLNSSGANIDIV